MSNHSFESTPNADSSPDGCKNLTQFKILMDQISELWGKGQYSSPEIARHILWWLRNLAGLLLELEQQEIHSMVWLARLEERIFQLERRLAKLEVQRVERGMGDSTRSE